MQEGISPAWVFVSHSSIDLKQVRLVRNFLEERGAAPLLFHMISLRQPEQFWPIIKREISERNFFLYCDSEAAQKSEWVTRERAEVEAISKQKPVRIGRIQVGNNDIDTVFLEKFMSDINTYISYCRHDSAIVEPFRRELEKHGFNVRDYMDNLLGADNVSNARATINQTIDEIARDGWLILFLSNENMRRAYNTKDSLLKMDIERALTYKHKTVPILLDREVLDGPFGDQFSCMQLFDATVERDSAPARLARHLLIR